MNLNLFCPYQSKTLRIQSDDWIQFFRDSALCCGQNLNKGGQFPLQIVYSPHPGFHQLSLFRNFFYLIQKLCLYSRRQTYLRSKRTRMLIQKSTAVHIRFVFLPWPWTCMWLLHVVDIGEEYAPSTIELKACILKTIRFKDTQYLTELHLISSRSDWNSSFSFILIFSYFVTFCFKKLFSLFFLREMNHCQWGVNNDFPFCLIKWVTA